MERTANLRNRAATRKKTAVNITFLVFMTLLGLILIFPYFYMAMRSLMTGAEIIDPTIKIIPSSPQFNNYIWIFTEGGYLRALVNTMIIIAFNVVAVPVSASLVAFSFAKLKWYGRNFMFAVMLGTIMLPGIVTQIPLFVIYSRWFKWLNTLWPFTVPSLFGGGAFAIFLVRQFMLGIPKELDEAAKVDGANVFMRYLLITMPLCKTILIYLAVTTFIGCWGDYYGPLVYMISAKSPFTLAFIVFRDSVNSEQAAYLANFRMAGGVVMTVPPLILFALFQRQLIDGVATMGIKG